MPDAKPEGLLGLIAQNQDVTHYQNLLWEGSPSATTSRSCETTVPPSPEMPISVSMT